jgi:conserved hypothetical protein TIGR01213
MDVLAVAAAARAEGPLCDPCLGRVVADRSHGLSNAERGAALRVSSHLQQDTPTESVEPEECWVCGGLTGDFDAWADRCVAAVEETEFETYQVGSRPPPLVVENDRLLRELIGIDPDAGESIRSELNREVGKRIGGQTDTMVEFTRPHVQFIIDVEADTVIVEVNSAFIYGRYRKLRRDIPQTKWPCSDCDGSGRAGRSACPGCDGTGFRYPTSVEQEIAPIIEEIMAGVDSRFHGAGREDVDARMLGEGRPFVVEVLEPQRRTVDTEALARAVNAAAAGAVEVSPLQLASYEQVERVKSLPASKRYQAEVRFAQPVTEDALSEAMEALTAEPIEQYTPQRVDHRRAALTRVRSVYEATVQSCEGTEAVLEIHGEGGLYIKELISGDEGRTVPSVAGLVGTDATVTALDVLAVTGEEESFEDPAYLR